jgi:hypothetical protein
MLGKGTAPGVAVSEELHAVNSLDAERPANISRPRCGADAVSLQWSIEILDHRVGTYQIFCVRGGLH